MCVAEKWTFRIVNLLKIKSENLREKYKVKLTDSVENNRDSEIKVSY